MIVVILSEFAAQRCRCQAAAREKVERLSFTDVFVSGTTLALRSAAECAQHLYAQCIHETVAFVQGKESSDAAHLSYAIDKGSYPFLSTLQEPGLAMVRLSPSMHQAAALVTKCFAGNSTALVQNCAHNRILPACLCARFKDCSHRTLVADYGGNEAMQCVAAARALARQQNHDGALWNHECWSVSGACSSCVCHGSVRHTVLVSTALRFCLDAGLFAQRAFAKLCLYTYLIAPGKLRIYQTIAAASLAVRHVREHVAGE